MLAGLSGNLVFGSGLIAAAVPLAALLLPDSFLSPLNIQHQVALKQTNSATDNTTAIIGGGEGSKRGNSLLSIATNSGWGLGGGGGLQGRVESVMGWVERSIEHLPNFPRLHPQECVKRSICEANNEPEKYGALGLTLRLLFPATNLSHTDRMDDMDYKVINKYRHAAGFGLNKRLENNNTGSSLVCREKYEDCLVSLLDVARNIVDMFLK